MDNQKEHTDIPTHKGHVKDHTQWVAKKKTGDENLAIHKNNPPEILKITEHGIYELTRQKLVKTGLVTDPNEPSNTNEDQGSEDKETQEQTNDYHKPPNPNNPPSFGEKLQAEEHGTQSQEEARSSNFQNETTSEGAKLLDPIQENNEGDLKLPLINSTPNKFEALVDLDEDELDTRSDPGVEVDHSSTNFYTSDNEVLNDKLITSRKPIKKQAPLTDRQTRSSAKTACLSSH